MKYDQKWTPQVEKDKGLIKWNMESNKKCNQIGKNMNTYSKKQHECCQMNV
jgi:hypothetical protein